ncbi:meso-butanediol dehydrogenase/(S,S)-butanediol dehydrogenase/diacetyl reductase [Thermocatellispora tengchongensis]|uniref:Meso-butanediol dehydrogenase/(S,S)-butanediol dehydrogenase/diacetyl reductase n=1 Tax=Thermocatellispora tengchongensis TaxID=1073253 RepID=A0A840PC74_9ACTN|nr:SDR family oxidoreductase [Thermocatellispora tengchongensis]MBB5135441.1 meso-butanediol dehydrogenase/(S,S)-butanediol dehydrogenase/diacetyl reductase [Thermocatellispora tengchongensis]
MPGIALVTGAASGIGAATAERLRDHGWRVWAADLDEDGLRRLSPGITTRALDVADEVAVQSLLDDLGRAEGRLDGVAACAGIGYTAPATDTTPQIFDEVMRVNLRAVFVLARAAVPLLSASPTPSFAAIASELGTVGAPGLSAYGSSKAGVINLMRVLALEHAAQGVRFNAVAPGGTRTPMMEREQQRLGRTLADAAANIPLGRLAEPSEIAAVVEFVLSADSSFMTGSVLTADGGYTAR